MTLTSLETQQLKERTYVYVQVARRENWAFNDDVVEGRLSNLLPWDQTISNNVTVTGGSATATVSTSASVSQTTYTSGGEWQTLYGQLMAPMPGGVPRPVVPEMIALTACAAFSLALFLHSWASYGLSTSLPVLGTVLGALVGLVTVLKLSKMA